MITYMKRKIRMCRIAIIGLLFISAFTVQLAAQESKLKLPGKGLSQFDFFYAGESKEQNMYIVKSGRIVC